jgi:acylphosphatase
MMVRVRIVVSGIVQGVFFRHNTMRKAQEFGVNGWVKNRTDGKVEVLCEGLEKNVQLMIEWCKKGPDGAFVRDTALAWEEYTGDFKVFQIIHE